jgi:hypothetical protein
LQGFLRLAQKSNFFWEEAGMADCLKDLRTNMYLKRHPKSRREAAHSTSKEKNGVVKNMDNQEKGISIIGSKEIAYSMANAAEPVTRTAPVPTEEYKARAVDTEVAPSTQKAQDVVLSEELQDDFLLSQIDEFRVKAEQLQRLLRVKEEKALELQQIVNERSDKAEELQQIVNERQEKADGITAEVAKQINGMTAKVDDRLGNVDDRLGTLDGRLGTLDARLETMDNTMSTTMASEVETKFDTIRQSMLRMQQNAGEEADRRAEETTRAISEITQQFEEVKQVTAKMDQVTAEISEKTDSATAEISEKVDSIKAELADKIHTESVQSYRNTQELIKGIDERLIKVDAIDKGVRSVKTMTTTIVIITVLDLLGVAAAVAVALGLI